MHASNIEHEYKTTKLFCSKESTVTLCGRVSIPLAQWHIDIVVTALPHAKYLATRQCFMAALKRSQVKGQRKRSKALVTRSRAFPCPLSCHTPRATAAHLEQLSNLPK